MLSQMQLLQVTNRLQQGLGSWETGYKEDSSV